jgi:LacI family transcriptional regulator
VLIDSYIDDHHCHNVRIDDVYGGYLAAKYLLDKGHRDIAFFSGLLRDSGVMDKRLKGYEQALKEYGLSMRDEYIFAEKIDLEHGSILARRLLESKPPVSAVAVMADVLALGAVKAFNGAGLDVPKDISLIGFDDLQIAGFIGSGLTTVRQDIGEKGKRAVELLVQNIQKPGLTKREDILPLSLVERGSVRDLNKEAP